MPPPILIFTNTFPYETGETFLGTEFPYLISLNRPIVIIPLYGEGRKRFLPSPVVVTPPLLPFSPKERLKLLFFGIFNVAPLFFALHDFFTQRIWRSGNRIWQFGTSVLLVRSILSIDHRLFDKYVTGIEGTTLYFYWGNQTALILPFLRKRFHKKYPNKTFPKTIVRFHRTDLYEEAKGFLPFRNRLFPAIDLACPISQHGANYLKQRYGALAPPISVSPLGTVDYGLGPSPVPHGAFHLVSCANVSPVKRIELTLEALLWLFHQQRINQPVCWTHIGEGPLRSRLEATIAVQNRSNLLTINFCGYMSHEAIMEYYQKTAVDLFVSTSRSAGIPVSMMEALSFGIPVMATAVGGVPELVSDKAGRLLPENPTVEEVAQQLLDFIQLPVSERAHIRKQARAVWEAGWNGEVNFREFVSLL